MSQLNVTSGNVKVSAPPFVFKIVEPARDINIDDSSIPQAASTTAHPWWDSVNKKWVIPAGVLMAKITASGLYIPVKRCTLVSGGGAATATAVVSNAELFKVGDEVGDGTTKQTVQSIDYSTNTITVDTNWGTDLAGVEFLDEDTYPGAETAVGVLTEAQEYANGADFAASIYTRATFRESYMPIDITPQMKTDLGARVDWV